MWVTVSESGRSLPGIYSNRFRFSKSVKSMDSAAQLVCQGSNSNAWTWYFMQKCRVRCGTVDALLHFQPLLLYFKSKQDQKLSHNKANLYTQYHAKHKNNAFQKKFTAILKRVLFLSNAPHAWCILDLSMGYTSPVNKKSGYMHCIMFTWYPCKIGTYWLPLHFLHILITHYHCMAKQILWLPNIKWNQCSMLKIIL